MTAANRYPLVLAVAVLLAAGAVTVSGQLGGPGCVGGVGFNWPNAGRVYLAGLTQRSTTSDNPSRPFAVARANGLDQVRIFLGVDGAIAAWRRDPAAAMAGLDRLLSDARAHGVGVVVSNYPDLAMISALAGREYPSLAAAQRDLTTPGSTPHSQFGQWLQTVVPRLATHPNVVSWEVVNEPGYMLGMDNGTVSAHAGLGFVGHFSRILHELGARTVNGGGRPLFDPMGLSDEQLAGYAEHLDVLDDHIYPGGSATDARTAVADSARWFDRARQVSGRPGLPAMLGEVGSQPSAWFDAVRSEAAGRGWPVFAWAFDAYDHYDFTDQVNTGTLELLRKAAKDAARTNGQFPVQVGTPRCEPER